MDILIDCAQHQAAANKPLKSGNSKRRGNPRKQPRKLKPVQRQGNNARSMGAEEPGVGQSEPSRVVVTANACCSGAKTGRPRKPCAKNINCLRLNKHTGRCRLATNGEYRRPAAGGTSARRLDCDAWLMRSQANLLGSTTVVKHAQHLAVTVLGTSTRNFAATLQYKAVPTLPKVSRGA